MFKINFQSKLNLRVPHLVGEEIGDSFLDSWFLWITFILNKKVNYLKSNKFSKNNKKLFEQKILIQIDFTNMLWY